MSVPLYRSYQIRADLNVAAEQISQALGRARLLAQSGKEGARWGFHVPSNTLFRGNSYATRTTTSDELYPIATTITSAGLLEVTFSPVEGRPSATGTIVLTTISGEQRQVNIVINGWGIATTADDKLTICHKPVGHCSTLTIPDNAWPGHKGHGDTLGPCTSC
jgi:hypothetical protein